VYVDEALDQRLVEFGLHMVPAYFEPRLTESGHRRIAAGMHFGAGNVGRSSI